MADEPMRREVAVQTYISKHPELVLYEVYLNGAFVANLLPFLQSALLELYNADAYKRAYEEHLTMCARPILMR